MITLDDALAYTRRRLNAKIDFVLAELESTMRLDAAATGPENEDLHDLPRAEGQPWRLTTVEEVLLRERIRLETWRDERLAEVRETFQAEGL